MKKILCLLLAALLILSAAASLAESGALPSLREIYAEKFDIGTAVPRMIAANKSRMDFCATQFVIFTPENELKPDAVLDVTASRALAQEDDTAVAVRFDAAKPLLDYAKENGLKVHGHVLVWHSQTPDAFSTKGTPSASPLFPGK